MTASGSDRGLAEILGAWAADVCWDDLPLDVQDSAALRVLDTVGVSMAGARSQFARTLFDALGPRAQTPGNCSKADFAFINSALSSCLDFDDTHERTLIHPTAPALFAALGAAAGSRATGRELLLAVTVGVEIACRIAGAAPSALHARGFHPTGVVGVFGAAAAAALILAPDCRTIRNAVCLAASFGAEIMQPFVDGSDQRYLHSGNAAAAGFRAAQLAAAGMQGTYHAIEGPFGLFMSHAPDAVPHDFDSVVSDLGQRWESRSVQLKRYPIGFVAHPYIDAVLSMGLMEFERLVCVVPASAMKLICEPRNEKLAPSNATLARVSLPHMIAEAIVFGSIDASSFSAERLTNPRVRHLAARVHALVAGKESGPEKLVIMHSGRSSADVPVRKRSLSRDDVSAKFIANAGPQIGVDPAAGTARRLLALESEEDGLGTIFALLSCSAQIR